MNSRERRLVHLAMRDFADLKTESAGEGMNRCVVVYPKDYAGPAFVPPVRTASRFGGRPGRGGPRGGRGRDDRRGGGRDDRRGGGRGRGRRY